MGGPVYCPTGWDVKVVLPSAQKSWIGLFLFNKLVLQRTLTVVLPSTGKAYHIKEVTKGNYFHPKEDGTGEITARSRPLQDGELVN